MSTASNWPNIEESLRKLIQLSQAILACGDQEMDKMQKLINEREPWIARLTSCKPGSLLPQHEAALDRMVAELQEIDAKVQQKLESLHKQQSDNLGQVNKGKQALNSYRFPYSSSSEGLEGKG